MNQQDRRPSVGGGNETAAMATTTDDVHQQWKALQDGWDHTDTSDRLLEARFSRFHGLMLTVSGDGDKMGSTVYVGNALPALMSYIVERAPDAFSALAAERDRADRAEAALSRLSDAHDVHVEMDKTFEYECPQCRHEATG